MGICSKKIRSYLTEISGLPHRLEIFLNRDQIRYVDDSKSTSAQSLKAALGSFGETQNMLLIVGGSDKGDTFDQLTLLFLKRVKAMAILGDTKEAFIRIAQTGAIPYIVTDRLPEAVSWLQEQADAGDVLMLSPGCASF